MRMESFENESYDDALAYLTAHPEKIRKAWDLPAGQGGCLFAYATKDGGFPCGLVGCLTMIRLYRNTQDPNVSAFGPEITQAIRDDERLPDRPADITVEHLPVFAEWQRRLDDLAELEQRRTAVADSSCQLNDNLRGVFS